MNVLCQNQPAQFGRFTRELIIAYKTVIRSYALSLGALAMSLVGLRGAVRGELADKIAIESVIALIVFMGIGAIAGWIADSLLRDALKTQFRQRVEWYRTGMIEAGFLPSHDDSQNNHPNETTNKTAN